MKRTYALLAFTILASGCSPDSNNGDPVYGPVHNLNGTFHRFFKAGTIGDNDYRPRLDLVRHEPLKKSDLKEGEDVGILVENAPSDIRSNMNFPHVVVTTSKKGEVKEEILTTGGLRVARYGKSEWQIVVPLDFAKSLFERGESTEVEWATIVIKGLYHVAVDELGRIFPKILDLVPGPWKGETTWSRVGQVIVPMATSRVGKLSSPVDWSQETNQDIQFVKQNLVADPNLKGPQPQIEIERKVENKTDPFALKITLTVKPDDRCETVIVENTAPPRKIDSGCVVADNRLVIEKVGNLLLRSNKSENNQAVYTLHIRPSLLSDNTRLRLGDPRDFEVTIRSTPTPP